MPQSSNTAFSGIFVSYRRDDASGHAGRLFDRLVSHFGRDRIFMDVDTIEPGEDFVKVIEKAVGSCEILIAIIGKQWLSSTGANTGRLDNPKDFVRLEIATALSRDVRVIPVLVQRASMPKPEDLPEDLVKLTHRNAVELSDLRWQSDVDQLIKVMERVLPKRDDAARLAEAARQAEEERQRQEAQEKQRLENEKQLRLREEEAIRRAAGPRREQKEIERREAEERAKREAEEAARRRRKRMILLVVIASVAVLAIVAGIWIWRTPTGEQSANRNASTQQTGQTTSAPPTGPTQPPPGMVYVPGGEFMMGRDDGDEYERPAHRQTVKAFFIDAYEVTCGDYEKFVKEDSHPKPSGWKGDACPAGAARKPITGVTWGDAVAFCYWLSKKRLPTEQEWEFAARGTDGRRYPWGNKWRAELANADRPSGEMVDVGSYPGGKSPFGVFDMVGNAWEWTTADMTAYPGGKLPEEPKPGTKVLRGGSYMSDRIQAAATYRHGWPASGASSYAQAGLRCVKDAAEGSREK